MRALLAALVSTVVAAVSFPPPGTWDPVGAVLLSTADPDSLRDRLERLAGTTPAPDEAALALYYRGSSFERGAQPDSAIACYRRSIARDPGSPAPTALVDALLRRRLETDVTEAIGLLRPDPTAPGHGPAPLVDDRARLGWAYVLADDPKKGLEVLKPLESSLTQELEWEYRFARAYRAAGEPQRAIGYLQNLATLARSQDAEIAGMLREMDQDTGNKGHYLDEVAARMGRVDEQEQAVLTALGGRRVRFRASDRALIGGVLFGDTTAHTPQRAVVLLGGMGDGIVEYDSLITALRHSNAAVFLLDPRGWGWSVAPQFPLPDTWRGREEALEARVARDVQDAIDALAHTAHVDTSRCLVIGLETMAPAVLAAAETDPRIAAVALVDPWTAPVERGAALARARRLKLPTWIQIGIHSRPEMPFADTLYRAGPQASSQLVSVFARESGAGVFGRRPDLTPRFIRWMDEALKPRPTGRRARPGSPRSG